MPGIPPSSPHYSDLLQLQIIDHSSHLWHNMLLDAPQLMIQFGAAFWGC